MGLVNYQLAMQVYPHHTIHDHVTYAVLGAFLSEISFIPLTLSLGEPFTCYFENFNLFTAQIAFAVAFSLIMSSLKIEHMIWPQLVAEPNLRLSKSAENLTIKVSQINTFNLIFS